MMGKKETSMIKNRVLLREFEESQLRKEAPDYHRNLRVFEALYQEARLLGTFPLKNPLDGIEVDIHLARVINSRLDSINDV
jgi:hypothetical protein